MRELIGMLSEFMPEDMIIDKMEEAIQEYKLTKNIEPKKRLTFLSSLLMRKEIIENVGPEELAKLQQSFEIGQRLQNTEKN